MKIIKRIALLTATACSFTYSSAILSSASDSSIHGWSELYAVVGIKNQDLVIQWLDSANSGTTFYLPADLLEVHLSDSSDAPEYGDILQLKGSFISTELTGTNQIEPDIDPEDPLEISVVGTLTADNTTETFTVSYLTDYGYVGLENADGEGYYYIKDYIEEDYTQPNGIDWADVKVGNEITMIVYDGQPVLPVSLSSLDDADLDAEPYPAFAVIGVDNEEAPERYIVLNVDGEGFPRYISAAELAPFMPADAEAPKYGDVLEVRTGYCEEPLAATAAIYFDGVASNNEIFRLYSLLDTENTEVFTVNGLAFATNFPVLVSQDSQKSIYANDFLDRYVQPGTVDMGDLKKGDEVTMYVVGGNPVLPVSASPLGDANGDGSLDVLDVIILNKYILGGGSLPSVARSGGSNRADFNGDGVVDGTDSLSVMKRIVGLEEAAE